MLFTRRTVLLILILLITACAQLEVKQQCPPGTQDLPDCPPADAIVDEDINTRDWKDVIWAMTTRMDPARDTTMIENTPIDYLDFASPVSGLGSKIGFDATNKWPGESNREWGEPIVMDEKIKKRVDEIWEQLNIF